MSNPLAIPPVIEAQRLARFARHLARALALPPREAAIQHDYAPDLAYGRHAGPPPPHVRHGAVLVLLYPDAHDWHVALTVRTSHLSSHAGQVSFPGGRLDPGETSEQAAVREFAEELGELKQYELLGRLPDVNVYVSNFLVTPVVAITPGKPRWIPNPHEVADVVELSLSRLAERSRRGRHEIVRGPLRFSAPHLRIGGHRVWGATRIILGELLERLEALGPLSGW
jgi:8-oxo-dGTP pyrophosphatase MutT (NUDIX family)